MDSIVYDTMLQKRVNELSVESKLDILPKESIAKMVSILGVRKTVTDKMSKRVLCNIVKHNWVQLGYIVNRAVENRIKEGVDELTKKLILLQVTDRIKEWAYKLKPCQRVDMIFYLDGYIIPDTNGRNGVKILELRARGIVETISPLAVKLSECASIDIQHWSKVIPIESDTYIFEYKLYPKGDSLIGINYSPGFYYESHSGWIVKLAPPEHLGNIIV